VEQKYQICKQRIKREIFVTQLFGKNGLSCSWKTYRTV
jgi:hypothetical protein